MGAALPPGIAKDSKEVSEIQVRVEEASQLFNTLDPFPFRERDLDDEAEAFIVGWARELPRSHAIRVVIHLPAAQAKSAQADELGTALNEYFGYRAEIIDLDLKELFRVGRRSFAIGFTVLTACLIASRAYIRFFGPGQIGRILEEGLMILGWVANWKPLEIFLYDWWPIAQRRQLYRRLAHAKVVLKPEAPSLPQSER